MKSDVIAYPLAYSNNQITSIKDAKHGTPYYCIECKNPMIPKMGKIKIHHFSHKYLGDCNPNNALHETAKT